MKTKEDNKEQLKHAKLMEKLEALKQSRYLLERQWIVNYLSIFTKDKYVLKVDGSISRLQTSPGEKNKLYTKISKLLPIYRGMYSKIVKSSPIFRVEPDRIDATDETGTDLAEAIIKSDYQKWKREGVIDKNAVWFLITGNAYSKPYFKDDAGNVIGFDEDKQEIKEGDIAVKAISTLNIYHEWHSEINTILDSRYVFETMIVDREYARKAWKITDSEGAISDSLKYKILLAGDYIDVDNSIKCRDYCELIIYTEKKSKYNKKGEYLLMTDKRILTDKNENPFPDTIGHPYCQAKMIENGTALGDTSFNYSTEIDKQINLSRGQLNEHAEKLSSPIMGIPMKSTIASEKIGNRNVKVVRFDERYGKPEYIQPSEFTQYFHLNEQKFVEDLNDINAVHDPTKAKRPSGVRSALMLAYLGEQDDLLHAPMIDSFFAMLESLGHKYFEMKKEFMADDEMDLKLFGNKNIAYTKYKGSQLKGNTNLKVFVMTGLPHNRIARQQILMELGASRILNPSLIRELLEFGELDPVYRIGMKDRVRQHIECDTLKKGKPVEVKIEDNHLIHIAVIIEWAKTSEFMKLPFETQTMAWKHVEAHITQMVTTFEESPLVAHLVLKTENIDPETKEFIMAEIQKSASARQNQNPTPPEPPAQPGPGGPAPAQPTPEEIMQSQGGLPPNASELQAQANRAL